MVANRLRTLLLTGLCLAAAAYGLAACRDTIVFISDLHMNMDTEYAWLRTNAPALAAFLNKVNARDDVSELVILGDMLDDWVETVDNKPHTFAQVLASPNNAEVVTALRSICANPNVLDSHKFSACSERRLTAVRGRRRA